MNNHIVKVFHFSGPRIRHESTYPANHHKNSRIFNFKNDSTSNDSKKNVDDILLLKSAILSHSV